GVGEQIGCDFAEVGASTVTTSLANIAPAAAVDYISARLAGKTSDPLVAELVSTWESSMSASVEGVPSFLKEAMAQSAGWSNAVRSPLRPADEATRDAIA